MSDAIGRYLDELERNLPRGPKRRLLAEVEDHLREAEREDGAEEAVRRFGSTADVARQLRPLAAVPFAQVGVLALIAALLSYPALYPVVENTLPPAPWPEGAKPAHLAWKQDAVAAFVLLGAGAGLAALATIRRRAGAALAASAIALASLGTAAAIQIVLGFQWAEAVPGTPGWLRFVALGHVFPLLLATAALGRAAWLRSMAASGASRGS